jgi:hypothetical protein
MQFDRLPIAASGPAAALPLPPLRYDIERLPLEGSTRKVRLRLYGRGGFRTRLLLPRAPVVAWSLSSSLPPAGHEVLAELFAIPEEGWALEVELEGAGPVPLEVREFIQLDTADIARVRAGLPAWADLFAYGAKAEIIPL